MIDFFISLLKPFSGIATYFMPLRSSADEEILLKDRLLVYSSVITSAFALLYCAISLLIGFFPGVALEMLCFVLLYANLFHFKRQMYYRHSANLFIANCFFVSILGCSFFSGGLFSMVTPWFALVCVTGMLLLGFSIDTLVWLFLCTALPLIYGALAIGGFNFPTAYNTKLMPLFFTICLTGLVLIIFCLVTVFESSRLRAMRQLQEKNLALAEAYAQAESATKAKSNFLANMSHEIRTPLHAVIGFSSLVRKTNLSHKQSDYIEKIEQASKSLLSVVNDILDISKLEAGKMTVDQVRFNLEEVLQSVSNMISMKAEEKGLEYLYQIDADVPHHLEGDSLHLGQVLLNLANNALKFTHHGMISIRVSLVALSMNDCTLRFMVSDTGIGIPAEQLEKLFEPFTQADASITRNYGGTGLGLSICKGLVAQMGGDIQAVSTLGAGSTFTFTLPLKLQPHKQRSAIKAPYGLLGSRVLVVDDNATARQIIAEQLTAMGLEVDTAANGYEAIDRLTEVPDPQKFHLVILDWMMPGIDGVETAKTIINNTNIPNPPVVMMVSAHHREDVVEQVKRLGIKNFVVKPINPSLLYDAVVESLGHSPEARTATTPHASQQNHLRFEASRVLLVEDNTMNQQIALELLSSAGLQVTTATNGSEALYLLGQNAYDLVLMDLQMPIMDGLEATAHIRENHDLDGMPIIVMTAHTGQEILEECLRTGANDYISKPLYPEALLSKLARFLPYRRLQEHVIFHLPSALARVNHNEELLNQILRDFSQQAPDLLDALQLAWRQPESHEVKSLLHNLKGIAGNLSLNALSDATRTLESEAQGRWPLAEVALEDVTAALKVALKAIDAHLEPVSYAREYSGDGQPRLNTHLSQRLLIVDDQVVNVEMLKGLLEVNYQILTATSGEACLEMIQSGPLPDIILLDIVMPGIDGYQLCRRLKSTDATRHIPIIFITSKDTELDEVKGFEAGAVDYISKPFNPTVVRARVHTHAALKHYRDQLEFSTFTDLLTGLPNRRRFEVAYETAWQLAKRDRTPISLLMMDVDHFKDYNDAYGHLAGDSCLEQIGGALRHVIKRKSDTLCRYGGEEFICILPNTDTAAAEVLAHQLRDAVEALAIPHEYSSASHCVTISVGLATLHPAPEDTPKLLIDSADQALYVSKSNGRNRVSTFS